MGRAVDVGYPVRFPVTDTLISHYNVRSMCCQVPMTTVTYNLDNARIGGGSVLHGAVLLKIAGVNHKCQNIIK